MSFPQPIFQVIGTQLKPYYSRGGSAYTTIKESSGTSADASLTNPGGTGVFGSSVISYITSRTSLAYNGQANWTSTGAFAILLRLVPNFTGLPSAQYYIFQAGDDFRFYHCSGTIQVNTAGKLVITLSDSFVNTIFAAAGTHVYSFTSGTATDIMVEWDGTATAGSIKCYQDGALQESLNPSRAAGAGWTNAGIPFISFGDQAKGATGFYLNECCIFDQTVGAYATRSGFVTSLQANGDTLPAVSNVRSGTVVGLNTGTCVVPSAANVRSGTSVDATTGTCAVPTAANVLSGVAVDATTGTLSVPTAANVRSGVTYGASTGTLAVPAASDVRAGTAVDAGTGTLDLPQVATVLTGVTFDGATKTGTLTFPSFLLSVD